MAIDLNIQQKTKNRQWWALAVLMIPVLLVSIDNLVLSFALPEISRELQPSGNQLLWLVDVYALMLAGLLIAMGSLGDRIGRRRLLLIGATGFGLVSVLAAFSQEANQLIIARALLGFFGAMLMPSTLSLIRNIFTEDRSRRIAIATWAAGFSAGAALGPILGGWLLEHFWWGSVFLVNVPLIAIFLPLAIWLLPESKDPAPGPFDFLSIVGSMAVMVPFVFLIKHIAGHGVDSIALALVMFALLSAYWFARRQLKSQTPMVDFSLFKNRVFSGALLANGLSMMGLTGFLFVGTQLLQLVLGLSPMQAAMVLLPGLIICIVAGFGAVRLVERFSARSLIAGSFFASGIGYAVLALIGQPTSLSVLIAFSILSLGIGIAETLTNDLVLASVPENKAGAAAALSETAYEIGAVLGVAFLGSVLTAAFRSGLSVPSEVRDSASKAAFETLGGTLNVAETLPESLREALTTSAFAAYDVGVQLTAAVAIVLTLLAAWVSWRALAEKTTAQTRETVAKQTHSL